MSFGAQLDNEIALLKERLEQLERRLERAQLIDEPITVQTFLARHSTYTLGQVRAWLFDRETNGLVESGAVQQRGRRLWLREGEFLRWITAELGPARRGPGFRRAAPAARTAGPSRRSSTRLGS
jgi:hypothetical protein